MPLGKWAAMVVVGKNVTEDQAKEIIVRTSGLYFSSNNHEFVQALYEHVFKKKFDEQKYHSTISDYYSNNQECIKVMNKYGILRGVEHLKNHQIVSSFIGGPHGWCNWDGSILTNSYNIGKYPSENEIYKEWIIIAEAFPYLDLKCQLWDKECTEDNNIPEVQYNIKNGMVATCEPEDLYIYPRSGDICKFVVGLKYGRRDFECGCTLENAIKALDYVEEVIKQCPK
jgi:uncharacterized ubiquitin-like protein YukD